MKAIATVTHSTGNWVLSLDGQSLAYRDPEEAVEEARRLLREGGGGEIDIGGGPGVAPERIEVAGGASSIPPARVPEATNPPSSTPPAPTVVTPATAQASDISTDIAALRASYQKANGEIEAFADPIERDIGLATLRLEAAYTLNRLRASGPGLTEADLHPLSSYVVSLTGGQGAEAAVEAIDQVAEEIAQDVGESLAAMSLTGSVALIFGVFAWMFNLFADVGAETAAVILAGGSAAGYFLLRLVAEAGPIVEKSFDASWGWASELGARTDRAMTLAREIEHRLWSACTSAPALHEPFADKARSRARLILFFSWGALLFAGCAVVWGFGSALLEFFSPENQGIPTTEDPFGLESE